MPIIGSYLICYNFPISAPCLPIYTVSADMTYICRWNCIIWHQALRGKQRSAEMFFLSCVTHSLRQEAIHSTLEKLFSWSLYIRSTHAFLNRRLVRDAKCVHLSHSSRSSVPTKRQYPDSACSKLLPDQKQNLLPDSEASVDIGAPVETEAPNSAEANALTRASIKDRAST